MSLVGFTRLCDGSGLVWADTEGYRHDEPMGEPIDKLCISSGGLVGVSVGYVVLVREFRRLVAALDRAPFALAIASFPAQLRQIRDEWRAELHSVGREYVLQTTFALCGYSETGFRAPCSMRRMLTSRSRSPRGRRRMSIAT